MNNAQLSFSLDDAEEDAPGESRPSHHPRDSTEVTGSVTGWDPYDVWLRRVELPRRQRNATT